MNLTNNLAAKRAIKYSALLQTASFIALATITAAKAQVTAPPAMASTDVTEQVLVTGSLIHGAATVGVPVSSFGAQDLLDAGAVSTADLFKDVPSVVTPQSLNEVGSGGTALANQGINIHNLSANNGALRTLMMIDGMRYPGEGNANCMADPGIINQLAIDHIDLLADGASATYGSDAEAGVINIILKRGFDGAISQIAFGESTSFGGAEYRASQLYGKTWEGGDITVSFEYSNVTHINASSLPLATQNFLNSDGTDNRDFLIDSLPATISTGSTPTLAKPQLATNSLGQNPNTAPVAATTPQTLAGLPGSFAATMGTACANCYAVPVQNGIGLTWAAIVANTPTSTLGGVSTTLGYGNEQDAWRFAYITPDLQRTGATLTFDQNITPDIQLFIDAFYSNRRGLELTVNGSGAPTQTAALSSVAVPTGNPFYPTGAPANFLVDYNLIYESPIHQDIGELGEHYDFGFNLNLPYKWLGKVHFSNEEDETNFNSFGAPNPNTVSAALGWTIPASSTGNSFAKPVAVPYLNLFCDPLQFTCNSPVTLAYITGFRDIHEQDIVTDVGVNFDGPVYTLPAGDVKVAVGAVYNKYAYEFEDKENYNNQSLTQITDLIATQGRTVYAGFGQVNIPLVGGDFTLPLVEKLDLEASVRYDAYSDVGNTFNPKVSATWEVIDGLQLKGAWGTAFRAPQPQEVNGITGGLIAGVNQLGGVASNNTTTCPTAGVSALAGSPAAILDPNCATGLQSLGGISLGGGSSIATAVRPDGVGGGQLSPETAQNLSVGWEWAPTDSIFKGLDIEATYYFVRLRNKLQGCASQGLDSPLTTDCYVTPASYGEPINPATGGPVSQAADPAYEAAVNAIISNPKSQLLSANVQASNISYIFDGATTNIGWQSINGVDFQGNYNWDMGGWGAWNTGLVGNYILDNKSQLIAGTPVISLYHTTISGFRDSGGQMRYRAHLGWTGGPDDAWSFTTFMNFFPHLNANGGAVPPICFLQGQTPCNATGMAQYAQYTQQYPTLGNFAPGMYTFDLQIGYKTHDAPANEYLKNIGVTLQITDLFNRAPAFQYVLSQSGANIPHGFSNNGISIEQRTFLITLTKDW